MSFTGSHNSGDALMLVSICGYFTAKLATLRAVDKIHFFLLHILILRSSSMNEIHNHPHIIK